MTDQHSGDFGLLRPREPAGNPLSAPLLDTGVDAVHAHAHKTGHKWLDLAIALSAITISVISLVVAIGHGRTEERLVAASSWPFLSFDTEKDGLAAGGWTIYLRLQNGGVGPARVKWLRLSLDGIPIRDRAELMRRCCGVPNRPIDQQISFGLVSQNPPSGVLPARERTDVLSWRALPGNASVMGKLDVARHRLHTEACYCSVLDECWVSDLTATADPRPVEYCSPVADAYAG